MASDIHLDIIATKVWHKIISIFMPNRCICMSKSHFYAKKGEKETMSSREMITLLIDIVSKGGNLLLDVGPMHDGSLSHIQESRLNDLADWMDINSEGSELTLEIQG